MGSTNVIISAFFTISRGIRSGGTLLYPEQKRKYTVYAPNKGRTTECSVWLEQKQSIIISRVFY